LLNSNTNKRCCIDTVATFNKQQLQYYITPKVAKNISNLLNAIFDRLNVISIVTTNNNFILFKDTVEFAINIDKKKKSRV